MDYKLMEIYKTMCCTNSWSFNNEKDAVKKMQKQYKNIIKRTEESGNPVRYRFLCESEATVGDYNWFILKYNEKTRAFEPLGLEKMSA